MRKPEGSILIVSLWTLAILFLLSIGLAYRVGLELRMTRYAEERLKTFYIAKAGLSRAMALLQKDSAEGPNSLRDKWGGEESLFKEKAVGDGFFSVSYALGEKTERKEVRYGMQDEESRIPLNLADAAILQKVPGVDEAVALSIRAWRGDKALTPEELAREDDYYASLTKPYPRKGKPFETFEELLFVRGVTPSLFEAMENDFTVYGSGKVNLNTASKKTLELLGLEETIAQRIIEARKGEDGLLGTEDDVVLEKVNDPVSSPNLIDLLGLDTNQQLALSNFLSTRPGPEMLAVQSTAFRVQVEGKLRQGNVRKKIVAVVDRQKRIRYWHED